MNLIVIKVINQIIIDFLFFWGGHSCGLPCVPSLKGRENVQFVSLQHNLIVRIDSLMHFRALMVLNLYDNKIERLSGLDTLKSLRVLMLGKNRCVDRPKKAFFALLVPLLKTEKSQELTFNLIAFRIRERLSRFEG